MATPRLTYQCKFICIMWSDAQAPAHVVVKTRRGIMLEALSSADPNAAWASTIPKGASPPLCAREPLAAAPAWRTACQRRSLR
mmetsp:Transcript_29151/g.56423  ORF Transcript_29151/g.56423 Transcript_29151/m.56423 type:complete len:83 (-) Transcript_29151:559-807(-)